MTHFKILKIVCLIGQLFALTPPSIDGTKQSKLQKTYAGLVLLMLTMGAILWYINRYFFYMHFIHLKIITTIIKHAIKYLFNFYTIMEMNFWKRSQWDKLMKILKQTEYCSNKKKQKCPFYTGFLMLNIMFWVIAIHTSYNFCSYFLMSPREMFFTVTRWYMQFLFNFLLYVIVKMLLERYRYLKTILTKRIIDDKKMRRGHIIVLQNNDSWICFLKKVDYLFISLKDAVDIFNNLFGWSILFNILYSSMFFLDYVDDFFILTGYYDVQQATKVITINLTLIVNNFVSFSNFIQNIRYFLYF